MLATSLSTVAPPPQDDITKFVFSLVFTITMKWREIDKSFTLFKIDISFHSGLFLNKKLEVLTSTTFTVVFGIIVRGGGSFA
jgi:hypothetical protein